MSVRDLESKVSKSLTLKRASPHKYCGEAAATTLNPEPRTPNPEPRTPYLEPSTSLLYNKVGNFISLATKSMAK